MRDLAALFIHIIANITRLLGPGQRAMGCSVRSGQAPTTGPFRDRHQTVLNSTRVNTAFVFVRRRKKVRQICDGGNVQGLLGQCALAIVATLGALATLNL
jgi:hypothetical protein